jgi:hypothetical protein
LAPAAETFLTSLQESTIQLQQSEILSSNIALNLNSAALSSERIAPAFSLGEESSSKVAMNLESTVPAAEQASEFLAEGASATNALDINGRSYAASAAAAASNIAGAKVDARITADVFTGLSDRMNAAVNNASSAMDKIREAFHFGQMTQEQITQMRKIESEVASAENARERALERADRMEAMGLEKSAREARANADAKFTQAVERLGPDIEQAAKKAGVTLGEGGDKIGKAGESVRESSTKAADAIEHGGTEVSKALETAADPFKELAAMMKNDKLALEATLDKCRGFLENIDKNLPQHAMT